MFNCGIEPKWPDGFLLLIGQHQLLSGVFGLSLHATEALETTEALDATAALGVC